MHPDPALRTSFPSEVQRPVLYMRKKNGGLRGPVRQVARQETDDGIRGSVRRVMQGGDGINRCNKMMQINSFEITEFKMMQEIIGNRGKDEQVESNNYPHGGNIFVMQGLTNMRQYTTRPSLCAVGACHMTRLTRLTHMAILTLLTLLLVSASSAARESQTRVEGKVTLVRLG